MMYANSSERFLDAAVFFSALTSAHVSAEGFLNTGDVLLATDDRASFGHSVLLEGF